MHITYEEGPVAAEAWRILEKFKTGAMARAVECAALVDPMLFPSSLYGRNRTAWASKRAGYHLQAPIQGDAAFFVATLASRINRDIFPRNPQRLGLHLDPLAQYFLEDPANPGEPSQEELTPQIEQEIEQTLLRVAKKLLLRFQQRKVFSRMETFQRGGIVTGSGMYKLVKKAPPRMFRLDQYVLDRDPYGQLLTWILCETLDRDMLPAKARAAFEASPTSVAMTRAKNEGAYKREVELYTVLQRQPNTEGDVEIDDSQAVYYEWQEIEGKKVGDKPGIHPKGSTMPYRYVPFIQVADELYGHSKVEQHYGLHKTYEALSEMLVLSAAASARRIKIINKASGIKLDEYLRAPHLGAVYGDHKQIGEAEGQSYSDSVSAQKMWEYLSKALQMVYGISEFEPVERRTGKEVDAKTEQTAIVTGSAWAQQVDDVHTPFVKFYLEEMIDEDPNLLRITSGKKTILKLITPAVQTSLDAFSMDDEANRIATLTQLAEMYAKGVLTSTLDESRFIKRCATVLGLNIQREALTAQEKQQKMLRAAGAQAAPKMLENATNPKNVAAAAEMAAA